jgi:hypothetical protein
LLQLSQPQLNIGKYGQKEQQEEGTAEEEGTVAEEEVEEVQEEVEEQEEEEQRTRGHGHGRDIAHTMKTVARVLWWVIRGGGSLQGLQIQIDTDTQCCRHRTVALRER